MEGVSQKYWSSHCVTKSLKFSNPGAWFCNKNAFYQSKLERYKKIFLPKKTFCGWPTVYFAKYPDLKTFMRLKR